MSLEYRSLVGEPGCKSKPPSSKPSSQTSCYITLYLSVYIFTFRYFTFLKFIFVYGMR